MKKIIIGVAVMALLLSGCNNTNNQQGAETTQTETTATTPEAEVQGFAYKVDPASVVEWVGSKPTGKHNGTVNVTEGGLNVAEGKLAGGEFVLDMNSIAVLDLEAGKGKEDLEAHLKGTDPEKVDHFFNVKEFPTATFVLKSFDGKTVVGDLTVKGKTKEVSFPATVVVTDTEVTINSEPFKINRVDFGVNFGSKSVFDNLKDKFIDDEVTLVVKAKATK